MFAGCVTTRVLALGPLCSPPARRLRTPRFCAGTTRRDVLLLPAVGAAACVVNAAAADAVVAPSTASGPSSAPAMEVDARGVPRLALQPHGWNTWNFRGHKVNWLGAGDSGPIVVLIHGFGASAYHYRYVVPELSKHCRVFAMDCLGFGWSDKPILEYDGYRIWEDQISAFLREVAGAGGSDKAVLVGNSLGGYNSLSTAAAHPDLVRGIVLLNAAGRFDSGSMEEPAEPAADAAQAAGPGAWLINVRSQVTTAIKKAALAAVFVYTKQPARVRQVLRQVYVSDNNIDDPLVQSIVQAAQDSNASEVFYRILSASGTPVNRLLARLDNMPLFLLWGDKDPWCVPARATQIQQAYPAAERVDIDAGHCPHDDRPQLVTPELLRWVQSLPA